MEETKTRTIEGILAFYTTTITNGLISSQINIKFHFDYNLMEGGREIGENTIERLGSMRNNVTSFSP